MNLSSYLLIASFPNSNLRLMICTLQNPVLLHTPYALANSLIFITRNRNVWNAVIICIQPRFWCPSHALNRRLATCRFRCSLGVYTGSVCINTVFDDPRMLLDLVERQPLLWVDNKELNQNISIHLYCQTLINSSYAFDQIFGFWRHVTRNRHFTADDSFVCKRLRVLKWRWPN